MDTSPVYAILAKNIVFIAPYFFSPDVAVSNPNTLKHRYVTPMLTNPKLCVRSSSDSLNAYVIKLSVPPKELNRILKQIASQMI